MEVHLKGLPIDLTTQSLKKELRPCMDDLSIVDYTCDKIKDRKFGNITFLNADEGERFLRKHGKVPKPDPGPLFQSSPLVSHGSHRFPPFAPYFHQFAPQPAAQLTPGSQPSAQLASGILHTLAQPLAQLTIGSQPPGVRPPRKSDIARLRLAGRWIYVEPSTRPANQHLIQHLIHERHARSQRPTAHAPQPSAVRCSVLEVAIGKVVFSGIGAVPTFAHQSGTRIHDCGGCFGRHSFVVSHKDGSRMDISYDIIAHAFVDHRSLTLVLAEPPCFYTRAPLSQPQRGHRGAKWARDTTLPWWPDHAKYVSHCLAYQLVLGPHHQNTIQALKVQQLLPLNFKGLAVDMRPAPRVDDYTTSIKVFEERLTKVDVPFPIKFVFEALVWNNHLHPSSAMKVLDLMIRNDEELPRGLKRNFPVEVDIMKRLLRNIPTSGIKLDQDPFNPESLIKLMTKWQAEESQSEATRAGIYGPSLPSHQVWVFKAVVTPTRITLHGPESESKNKVLRRYKDHTDYFLRVSFMDENGQDLQFSPKISRELIFERYRKVLEDGICIAGRKFTFLGFSHSSLRSHASWFVAPFMIDLKWHTCESILEGLGDFSEIRVAAKCAARIGQAFSETPWAVDLFKTKILNRTIEDVTTDDGSRVFSDGVGTISQEAMQEIWNVLPARTAAPTCFQIRWGGVKGMLALDSRLTGKQICVRKSMTKFPSKDLSELGICDVASRPLRLYLNRQLIKILEDMGTVDNWFATLQGKALRILRGVTATAINTGTFLRYQSIGRPLGFPSFIKQLDKMGIDYRRDDFMRSVVEHVVLRELRLLKYKSRIPVDMGVALFGIMDETGWLKEDEVYVTFDKTSHRSGWKIDTTPADGPVIVARSPALHPGDVQVVNMRTPPEGSPLLELRNCIVFSQKGKRDLPSQLSGGDLDGDLYQVIWDKDGLPTELYEAADYPRVEAVALNRPVETEDMADFFVDFMRNDTLGPIAVRHQILADVRKSGTLDLECIELAKMHSSAVDFSKTGIPVDPQTMPKPPLTRPDFMAPAPPVKLYDLGQIAHIEEDSFQENDEDDGMGMARQRFHRSSKVLGTLYRGVDEKKIWSEDISRAVNTRGPSVWDQFLTTMQEQIEDCGIALDYKSYAEKGWQLRGLYEESMKESMWHHSDNTRGSITEVEAFCGSLLNKRGAQTRQQRDLSIQLLEKTDRIMTWIVKLMRQGEGVERHEDFDEEDEDDEDGGASLDVYGDSKTRANGDDGTNGASKETSMDAREEAIQRCWACLQVSCLADHDQKPAEQKSGMRPEVEMRSFRLVAATCLLRELKALGNEMKTGMSGGGYVGVSRDRPGGFSGLVLRPKGV
ncbi:hypothetical protein CDD80_2356 [Ophiocordyceps camponoti-rufipedis]|uniref:RNA-dependent RNA polymerase n=1 Tax=Ophiocordyceps camponoti-rufipedis TaxID=2004952 RepID=A0A2C5Z7U2_9HYPO|nr:hypothetical protein CDD80_2356 [Ophiocordyceps camponoti-rufipedis]